MICFAVMDFYEKLFNLLVSCKEVKLANIPWITPAISKMIKIRNKTFTRKKRQPNNMNIKRLEIEYHKN